MSLEDELLTRTKVCISKLLWYRCCEPVIQLVLLHVAVPINLYSIQLNTDFYVVAQPDVSRLWMLITTTRLMALYLCEPGEPVVEKMLPYSRLVGYYPTVVVNFLHLLQFVPFFRSVVGSFFHNLCQGFLWSTSWFSALDIVMWLLPAFGSRFV